MSYNKTDVLVIDKMNHHLFQPLLYQVATCALSPGDIANGFVAQFTTEPVRSVRRYVMVRKLSGNSFA